MEESSSCQIPSRRAYLADEDAPAILGGGMPIQVDLAGLEKSYREMSDEEFALVRRADLTSEAAAVYDRMAALRSASQRSAIHPQSEARPINLNSPRHLKMANYL